MDFFDILLAKKLEGGGGGDVTIEQLDVTENGTYSEPGKAYRPVVVNLPLDEKTITANGTYNASADNLQGYNKVVVNVSGYKLKAMPTGAIATITDAEALPLNDLKISVEPVQAGSGDPSPTNVRPISGWDEGNVSVCGKNLWGYGIGSPDVTDIYWGWYIPYNTKATIKLFDKGNGGNITNLYFGFTGNGNNADSGVDWMIRAGVVEKTTLETTTKHFISIYQANQEALNKLFNRFDVMVTIDGQSNTEYEAYKGNTYNIEFPSEAGTVYGGTLDVVSGELVVDRAYVNMGTLDWTTYDLATSSFKALLANGKITGTNYSANGICSIYALADYITALRDGDKVFGIGYANLSTSNCFVAVRDTDYSDATDFKTAMNGKQLVYELATPITHQLDPTSIRLLQGLNNIFADTGDILEGEYFAAL